MTTEKIVDVAEQKRLNEAREAGIPWKKWGPYLSERQWGTVREDYSSDGNAWAYFSHDQSRSRAYRWGEDGLGGISDDKQQLCFALALWNERDPILKERLFGLTNSEGNHGEDVKEYYFYVDSTPTHSYMKYLYKYPQAAYPYGELIEKNRRSREEFEYELLDTGVFNDNRYFDVFVEYAKAGPDDILVRITAHNRGPDAARLRLLPTLWFRNTWSWGVDDRRPSLRRGGGPPRSRRRTTTSARTSFIAMAHRSCCSPRTRATRRVSGASRIRSPHVKDAFHAFVVSGQRDAVNPAHTGTKAAAHYMLDVPAGGSQTIRLRLAAQSHRPSPSPISARCSIAVSRRPTNSTRGSLRSRSATTSGGYTGRRWPACSGASSSTTSIWSGGSANTTVIPCSTRRGRACGTPSGSTCSTPT